MDGVTDAKSLVKRAYEWGHPAIAITDHGVVQAFPEANHCFDAWGGCVPKDSDFKVLYGMEGYLVDDLKGMVTNGKGQKLNGRFVVFDIETTGFSPVKAIVYMIGCARRIKNRIVIDQYFAESVDDEAAVIEAFAGSLSGCSTIISFNGVGFDLSLIHI